MADSHVTRDDICIVCQCSSTWSSMDAMATKCKDVATKLNVGRLDVVLYSTALLPVQGLVRTSALVDAWTAMVSLRTAGLADHIGVCDFPIHELEFLLRRFPSYPVEVQCVHDVTPFSPHEHMVQFCHSRQIDVIACFSIQMESLTHAQKTKWMSLVSDITTAHQTVWFQLNLPFETVRVENATAPINQAIKNCNVRLESRRTPEEVLVSWLNQRGIIAVPTVEDDEPYDTNVCRSLFSLCHPFVKEHAAVAPSKPYRFVLSKHEMDAVEACRQNVDSRTRLIG
ncbi:hypothetical protein, variant [Aphanomyces invadans]|nr:hypothetical protein, variant [Aphanomyces invadans]ETV91563.1 hypothetical protein, variant [Aphanomyces invadans]|eukprot:XP_008879830.1 hypothetical protein, variant [Aphanomyces invadans]